MSAYFNLRQLLFLHFGLKYAVKVWLKYTHIFTLRAASHLSCALRLLASSSNVWAKACRATAPEQSEGPCKHSGLAASLLLVFCFLGPRSQQRVDGSDKREPASGFKMLLAIALLIFCFSGPRF